MTIQEKIKLGLAQNCKTQKELYAALELPGSTVNNWLTRGSRVPAKYVARIAEFLDVTVDYLTNDELDVPVSSSSISKITPEEVCLLNFYRERGKGRHYFGDIYDYFPELKKEPPLGCSEEAASLGARYDALDDDGKAVVRCSIINEERRLADEKEGRVQSPSEGKAV